jgi:hypothetical protein
MNNEARELSITEKNQVITHTLEAYGEKYRVKCAERASRCWKLPEPGERIIIGDKVLVVDSQGKQWTSGKDMVCYLYFFCEIAPPVKVVEVVETPAPAKPAGKPATAKQIAYAIKLGATNPTIAYDAFSHGNAYSRAQLEAMTSAEISEVISELKN